LGSTLMSLLVHRSSSASATLTTAPATRRSQYPTTSRATIQRKTSTRSRHKR